VRTLLLFVLFCAACEVDPDAGQGELAVEPDAGAPAPVPGTDQVDLLLVIDNSCSMTEEQASLTAELPRLLEVLATGDLDRNGQRDIAPLDVRVGVTTADMGTGGYTVPTCARADFGDDGILRTQGRTDLTDCAPTYPPFLAHGAGDDLPASTTALGCVANVGTGGCGFEQPLEAALKALSPSAPTAWTAASFSPPIFHEGTAGHGDGFNAGLVREDSVLAVVFLSDEEDCSALDPGLFDPSSATYGATDLNLRCVAHPDAVHPVARFVDGLLDLRREPSRLVYAPIVGLPTDLEPGPGEPTNWPRLVSEDPSVRDDRMENRVDPAMPSRLQPSCNVPGRGVAFPPVRILRVAEQLERRGAHVAPGSICQESFATPIDALIHAIVEASRGRP